MPLPWAADGTALGFGPDEADLLPLLCLPERPFADDWHAAQQDSGTFGVCPQPLPVSTLVHRAAAAHRPLAGEKGVAIEVAALPSTLAMADEHRVYQVFSNLIGNALRFTPAGGTVTDGTVTWTAVNPAPEPVCYVINTHAHPDHVLGNEAFAVGGEVDDPAQRTRCHGGRVEHHQVRQPPLLHRAGGHAVEAGAQLGRAVREELHQHAIGVHQPRPPRRADSGLADVLRAGAPVVDARPAAEFARRHVPGTLSVPLGKSFTTWAGSVLPYDTDFYLVAPDGADDERMAQVARDLAMIGLDRTAGWFPASAVDAAIGAEGRAGQVPDVQPDALEEMLASGAELVDVRNSSEYVAGHLAGAANVPLGRLAERLDELPRDRTLVVHCQMGGRASVAIGLLASHGFTDVRHLAGDYSGWTQAGRPVEKGEPVPA